MGNETIKKNEIREECTSAGVCITLEIKTLMKETYWTRVMQQNQEFYAAK